MKNNKIQLTIISGTNRHGSYSLRLAQYAGKTGEALGCDVSLLDLCELPAGIFSGTSYGDKPGEFASWQKQIDSSDALVFCVPEYNGGVPGVLKYFIDMLTFPDSFEGKPVCLLGLSAGTSGAANALDELTRLLNFQHAAIFPKTVTIPRCYLAIDEQGKPVAETAQQIAQLMSGFIETAMTPVQLRITSPVENL